MLFAAKPESIAVSESRFNAGSEKISCVCNPASGFTTTKRAGGSARGVILSPMPSTHACLPHRKKGTSAPSERPMRDRLSSDSRSFQRRFSASKVDAASDEPPPIPACAGTDLAIPMCAPSAQPVACFNALAARTTKSSCGSAHVRSSRLIWPSVLISKCRVSHQSINIKTDCNRW